MLLNAVGIAHIYTNCTTAVTFNGIVCALDTLASNAYGKNNYCLIGAYFDRCRFISIVFFVIILAFHTFFARPLLGFLKVDDSLMEIIIKYIQIYVFAQLFQVNFNMYSKLFVLIEKSYINLYLSVGSILVHGFSCGFFVYICDLGIKGGSIAFVITSIFDTVASTIVAHNLGLPKETFKYFTREGLQDWGEYFKVAIPSVLLNLGEWAGYEIQGIISIYISAEAYTTNILVINYENLTFPYTYGISVAVALKTGEKLMTSTSKELKRFITIMYGFSFTLSMIVLVLIYMGGDAFFSIMAPEKVIFEKCCEVVPFILPYILFTNGFYFYMHVLKGVGYLTPPTIATFVNFYLIQITLSYILVFIFDFEVKGIYSSMSIGSLLTFILFAYWVYSKDLDELKQNAESRIDNYEKKLVKIEMKPISDDNHDKLNEEINDNQRRFLE